MWSSTNVQKCPIIVFSLCGVYHYGDRRFGKISGNMRAQIWKHLRARRQRTGYLDYIGDDPITTINDPPRKMQQIYEGWQLVSAKNCGYYDAEQGQNCPVYLPADYSNYSFVKSAKVVWDVISRDGASTSEETNAAFAVKASILEKLGLDIDIINSFTYEDERRLSGEQTVQHTISFAIPPSQCFTQYWRLQHTRTTSHYLKIIVHQYTYQRHEFVEILGQRKDVAIAPPYVEMCIDEYRGIGIYDGFKSAQHAPLRPLPGSAPVHYTDDFGGVFMEPCCEPYYNVPSPGHRCCGCSAVR